MARFGTWAPLAANWAAQSRLTTPDIICVHTMVGSLAGTDAMFRRNGYGGTFSHFGIGGDGSCTQWQDTDYRAAANYNGNRRIISVECADVGAPFAAWNTNDGSAVPAFSDAQIETLARLIATVAPAHNIPIVVIPDALPGRRGIGYHRLGVPGYMAPGAEQWSTAVGKVCPGTRRIAQIPGVVARAQAPTPIPFGGFLMALSDAQQLEVYNNLRLVTTQMCGQTFLADGQWGWPTADGKKTTLVDMLRGLFPSKAPSAAVSVDATSFLAALKADPDAMALLGAAFAKAVNDDAAKRLQS